MHMTVSKKTHCAPRLYKPLTRIFTPSPSTFIVRRLAVTADLISLSPSLLFVREGGRKSGRWDWLGSRSPNDRLRTGEWRRWKGREGFISWKERWLRGKKSIFPRTCTMHSVFFLDVRTLSVCVVVFLFFFFHFYARNATNNCCSLPHPRRIVAMKRISF